MGYTCFNCGQPQPARSKPRLVVTAVRKMRYQVNEAKKKSLGLKSPFIKGEEIVEEILLCDQCPDIVPVVVGSGTIYLNGRKELH